MPSPVSASPGLALIDLSRRARAVIKPIRLRILQELGEPDSASGLARRFHLPRQRVNYHLRELERDGFVELVEERRKGNFFERIFRATARAHLVDAGADPAAGGSSTVADRFSASYLVAAAARAIREVALLRSRAEQAGKRLPTITLQTDVTFRSAADRNAFAAELAGALGRLAAKYHDEVAPGGRRFRFFVAGHPALAEEKEDRESQLAPQRGSEDTGASR